MKLPSSKAIKQVNPREWYTIAEICDRGWIVNTTGRADRFYVNRLVRNNTLAARDFGVGKKIMRVQGTTIINFIKQRYL